VLRDKISGRIFAGINRFVDGGDAGDEYNYSPPRHHDTIIRSPEDPPKIVIERSQVAESLTVRMTYRVPAGLTPDRSARSPERVDLPIETTLFLYRGIRRLDIETQVKNEAKDHRLRVHFPTGIAASEAWADTAFDVVARDTGVPDHGQDWPEKPVGTYPQQGFVDVHDHDGGLAVASDGLPEYEVLIGEEGSTIAVTLLRCVGWLSRDDLVTRSGLAGPILPTPRAQCIDVFRHRYALIPHEEGWQGVFLRAREYLAPLRCTMVWGGNPRPVSQSLVTVEPVEVVISAIKQPEDGQGLVVRVFNPLPHAVDMTMSLALPFKSGVLATLREEPDPEEHAAVEARFVSPGYFRMKLERKRIQTILFT
jgi:alpha-mannosidase